MLSTSENATRSNKRRRTDDVANSKQTTRRTSHDGQAVTNAATNTVTRDAAAADPFNLVGTRLEPLIEDLASQPKKLQPTIIEIQKSMLDLLANIKQRQKSSLRFTKPVRDTKTGEVLTDENGAPKKFVPNSCRLKCPVEASSSF